MEGLNKMSWRGRSPVTLAKTASKRTLLTAKQEANHLSKVMYLG